VFWADESRTALNQWPRPAQAGLASPKSPGPDEIRVRIHEAGNFHDYALRPVSSQRRTAVSMADGAGVVEQSAPV
jgi:NADPH:quinone reductase-like Zn-dependent oxidoreductase